MVRAWCSARRLSRSLTACAALRRLSAAGGHGCEFMVLARGLAAFRIATLPGQSAACCWANWYSLDLGDVANPFGDICMCSISAAGSGHTSVVRPGFGVTSPPLTTSTLEQAAGHAPEGGARKLRDVVALSKRGAKQLWRSLPATCLGISPPSCSRLLRGRLVSQPTADSGSTCNGAPASEQATLFHTWALLYALLAVGMR